MYFRFFLYRFLNTISYCIATQPPPVLGCVVIIEFKLAEYKNY